MHEPVESSPDEDDPIAPMVAGFEHFSRIGSGSSSTVYSAVQLRMNRPVAIKVMNAALASDTDQRAFERECRAMGVLSQHPNIVTVYSDATTVDGRPCLVMELYHDNYRRILADRGPLALDELLLVGVKVAGALQAAHDTGVLHRDIKPHNVFVSDFGEPALGDFGISSIDDERATAIDSGLSVAYAAPEVIEDADASFLSDVYSLAATLHHLAAGQPPFAGGDLGSVAGRVVSEAAPALDRHDLPESLQHLIRRGLSKMPNDRPDSAGDFAESLRDIRVEVGLDATPIPLRSAERIPDGPAIDVAPTGDANPRTASAQTGEQTLPERVQAPTASPQRRRPRLTDHVAVDVLIALLVIALVIYAVTGLR